MSKNTFSYTTKQTHDVSIDDCICGPAPKLSHSKHGYSSASATVTCLHCGISVSSSNDYISVNPGNITYDEFVMQAIAKWNKAMHPPGRKL